MNKIAKIAGIGTVLASSAFVSAAHVNNTKQSAQAEPKEIAVSKPQNDTQITYIWNNGNPIPQKRESNGSELPFAITTAMAGAGMLRKREDINKCDKNGNTPLHNALKTLQRKYNDYTEYFFKSCKLDVQNAFKDVIEIIDNPYFDVTKKDFNGYSYISKALNIICKKEHQSEIINKLVEKCLLSSTYDPNSVNQFDETDIKELIDYEYYEQAAKLIQLNTFDSAKRYGSGNDSLLQQVVDEYTFDNNEEKLICTSLVNKNINNDKYNPNETDESGNTDAMTLLQYGLFDDAKKVMELETFDASKRNEDSIGYIHSVLRGLEYTKINKKEFVSYVVDRVLSNPNYDPNISDDRKETDLEKLSDEGYIEDALKIMKDSRFDVSKNNKLLSIIFKDKNVQPKIREEFINQYVEKAVSSNEYNIYTTDKEGYTDMHYLARYGYLEQFDKMLRTYPYFDMNMPAKDGQTAAMLYLGSELSNRIINAPISAEK